MNILWLTLCHLPSISSVFCRCGQDIRPSPNPTHELQRAMTSLAHDGWPEIFHALNSIRRLAVHHAALLSSQSNLHAMVRDVLGQAENLRSQVILKILDDCSISTCVNAFASTRRQRLCRQSLALVTLADVARTSSVSV